MNYLAAKYRLLSYEVDILVASYGHFSLILH
ncbi:unknown [Bacteroides sp. CAG:754]|nr:unknown [Bacteroides sp. CAG:754]